MSQYQVTTVVDCLNENCPMPLVKTRQAIMKAADGDIIEVRGTHKRSFEEIPMALNAMKMQIIEKEELDREWRIVFRVSGGEA